MEWWTKVIFIIFLFYRYEGQYFEDKKHGYGEFTWPDGRIYKVQFKFKGCLVKW